MLCVTAAQRLVSTEGQDVFEEVLELVSYFTYFSPTVRLLITITLQVL